MTLPGIGILTTGTANKKLLSNTFINSQKKILEIRKSPTLSKTISDLDILCWNEMKFKPSLSWYLFGIHFFLFFVRPPLYITLISWWKNRKRVQWLWGASSALFTANFGHLHLCFEAKIILFQIFSSTKHRKNLLLSGIRDCGFGCRKIQIFFEIDSI